MTMEGFILFSRRCVGVSLPRRTPEADSSQWSVNYWGAPTLPWIPTFVGMEKVVRAGLKPTPPHRSLFYQAADLLLPDYLAAAV
jgi:hypothetical protein